MSTPEWNNNPPTEWPAPVPPQNLGQSFWILRLSPPWAELHVEELRVLVFGLGEGPAQICNRMRWEVTAVQGSWSQLSKENPFLGQASAGCDLRENHPASCESQAAKCGYVSPRCGKEFTCSTTDGMFHFHEFPIDNVNGRHNSLNGK